MKYILKIYKKLSIATMSAALLIFMPPAIISVNADPLVFEGGLKNHVTYHGARKQRGLKGAHIRYVNKKADHFHYHGTRKNKGYDKRLKVRRDIIRISPHAVKWTEPGTFYVTPYHHTHERKIRQLPPRLIIVDEAVKKRHAPKRGTSAWLRHCKSKYRSFNPKTGYYTAYSGKQRICR